MFDIQSHGFASHIICHTIHFFLAGLTVVKVDLLLSNAYASVVI